MSSGEGERERNKNEIENQKKRYNTMGHFMQHVKYKGKKGCVLQEGNTLFREGGGYVQYVC